MASPGSASPSERRVSVAAVAALERRGSMRSVGSAHLGLSRAAQGDARRRSSMSRSMSVSSTGSSSGGAGSASPGMTFARNPKLLKLELARQESRRKVQEAKEERLRGGNSVTDTPRRRAGKLGSSFALDGQGNSAAPVLTAKTEYEDVPIGSGDDERAGSPSRVGTNMKKFSSHAAKLGSAAVVAKIMRGGKVTGASASSSSLPASGTGSMASFGPPKDAELEAAARTAASTPVRRAGAVQPMPEEAMEDRSIGLEHLVELKKAFEDADVDGEGTLDRQEFVQAFGEVLGKNMNKEQLDLLFMKIDANSDGTIDWDEFCTYVLTENQSNDRQEVSSKLMFTKADAGYGDRGGPSTRTMIDRILHLPKVDRYVTTGRAGVVRVWTPGLQLQKTVKNGASWITDSCVIPGSNRIAVSSVDRCITLYDAPSFEQSARIDELDNAPMCVTAYTTAEQRLVVMHGDDKGQLHAVRQGSNGEFNRKKNGSKLQLHSDWVCKVGYIAELGSFVTCSLDKTIKIGDPERMKLLRTLSGHKKGIYAFDWCSSYKFIASCGLERSIRLWNPFISKTLATLSGHSAAVIDVIVNEADNQLISVSNDKVIKIWDVRTHKCLQTIIDKSIHRPENRISAIMYDSVHETLVTGSSRMTLWPLRRISARDLETSHDHPVSRGMFNHAFNQVVSGDDGGNVVVWDVATGRKAFQYGDAHEGGKISAMQFDASGRRLVTGGHDGKVRVWNFNNGQLLLELEPERQVEITALCFISEANFRYVVAVGWSGLVNVWIDYPNPSENLWRSLPGHTTDVLAVAYHSPNILATGDSLGKIIVWNFESGSSRFVLQTDPGYAAGEDRRYTTDPMAVDVLMFLSASVLVSSQGDTRINLWDLRDGTLISNVDLRHAVGESISCMSYNKALRHMASADTKGYLKIWDVGNTEAESAHFDPDKLFRQKAVIRAHSAPISSLDWIKNDYLTETLLVTTSTDSTIRCWSLNGKAVSMFGQSSTWQLNLRHEPSMRVEPHHFAAKASSNEHSKDASSDGEAAGETDRPLLRRTKSGAICVPKRESKFDNSNISHRLRVHELSPLTYKPTPRADRKDRYHFTPPPMAPPTKHDRPGIGLGVVIGIGKLRRAAKANVSHRKTSSSAGDTLAVPTVKQTHDGSGGGTGALDEEEARKLASAKSAARLAKFKQISRSALQSQVLSLNKLAAEKEHVSKAMRSRPG